MILHLSPVMDSSQNASVEKSPSFRFRKSICFCSQYVESESFFTIAVPVDLSPSPDFDDADKVQQYIRDRRVVGVRYICISIHCPSSLIQYDPLVQPALLRHEITSTANSQRTIASARYAAAQILAGRDDRVLVIVGPCSIHSTSQAVEYAQLLKSIIPECNNLLIIMRAYLSVHLFPLHLSFFVDFHILVK
jgi:hypothetical protein